MVQNGQIMSSQPGQSGVKMFTDVHRFLQQRASDIETLKNRQVRNNKNRQEALVECRKTIELDGAERKAQFSRFTDEMQRYTVRKIEALHNELAEHEASQKRGDTAQQIQIDRMSRDVDAIHSGLCNIADCMDQMIQNCLPEALQVKVDAPLGPENPEFSMRGSVINPKPHHLGKAVGPKPSP